jgi:hypothetical protein
MDGVVMQEWFLAEVKSDGHLLFEPQSHQIDVQVLQDNFFHWMQIT